MSSEMLPFSMFDRQREDEAGALVFATPRLVSGTSAWVQHIPFAFEIMDLLRPASVVELGVHSGDSYCAFCQAAEVLKLKCACAGVDTWKGDVQAGLYDESVF